MNRKKKIIFSFVAFFLSLTIIFSLSELSIRVYYFYKKIDLSPPSPRPPYDARYLDDKYGWHVKPYYSWEGKMSDSEWKEYSVNYNTTFDGFRIFNSLIDTGRKKKIFFIGDSFTQAVEVADDKTFYSVIKDNLPVKIYAIGTSGWGNLQEYFVLQKYLDTIKPDMVILQICSSDFIDNCYELELKTKYGVGKRRPYLNIDNEVEYATPVSLTKKIKAYSVFLNFIMTKYGLTKIENGEEMIRLYGRKYPPFDKSVKLTELVIKKWRDKIPENVPFMIFSADHYSPQIDEFKRICNENNIEFYGEVAFDILNAEKSGKVVRSFDKVHWNEQGHDIVANSLINKIKEKL